MRANELKEQIEKFALSKIKNIHSPIVKGQGFDSYTPANIYLKMESQADQSLGGNKVRKLAFLLWEAIESGATDIIVDGISSSNCVMAVAHWAKEFNLKAHFLISDTSYNLPAIEKYKDLGAEVHLLGQWSAQNIAKKRIEIENQCIENSKKVYQIATGGSCPVGVLGSLHLGIDIALQEEELGFTFKNIIFANGTGGTYTGLNLANQLLERNWQLLPINIANNEEFFSVFLDQCVAELHKKHSWVPESINAQKSLDIQDFNTYDNWTDKDAAFQNEVLGSTGVYFDLTYNLKVVRALSYLDLSPDNIDKTLIIHSGGEFERQLPHPLKNDAQIKAKTGGSTQHTNNSQ